MVKIVIAGGTSGLKDAPNEEVAPGIAWIKTDYGDIEKLVNILKDVHLVLSFIVVHSDQENMSQKSLIDAAVQAGVKRFAPSEQTYLNIYIDTAMEILEYSLFQPGLFVNYLTYPYNPTKHITSIETPIDFKHRRLLTVDGGEDDRITLTTGEWPIVGGVKGSGSFTVDKLSASWLPSAEAFGNVDVGILLGISTRVLNVSDEWNQLLPNYKFTQTEAFLTEAWRDKP
ncbi:hypothetical protein BDV29DRAFT_195724 [Aspergillus leporis]|uniref:NmrA-like domain-containing protein n=1 Tax=Aspergillus leporis TaxID=41062 RepID=A0A5N5WIJ8_9EURO|nr:hypothetical protein BDV29DRAFT_195724 [Aspergillus leporis]